MNDKITDVQDNDLHQDTYVDHILNQFEDEITDYIEQPEDDNDDSSNIFNMDIAGNIYQPGFFESTQNQTILSILDFYWVI
jgi:hypothetical protein